MCLSASVKPFRSTAARPCAASALGDIAGTEPRCRSRSSSARQLRSKRPGGLRRRQDRQHGSPAPIPAAGRPLAVSHGRPGRGWLAAGRGDLRAPSWPRRPRGSPSGSGNGEPRPARSRSPPDQRAREPSSTRSVVGVGAGPRWGHLPAVPGPASLASSSRPVPPMGQRPAAHPAPPSSPHARPASLGSLRMRAALGVLPPPLPGCPQPCRTAWPYCGPCRPSGAALGGPRSPREGLRGRAAAPGLRIGAGRGVEVPAAGGGRGAAARLGSGPRGDPCRSAGRAEGCGSPRRAGRAMPSASGTALRERAGPGGTGGIGSQSCERPADGSGGGGL